MSDFENVKVFGNTSLSDLFKQIHKNNKDVSKQINELLDALSPIASKDAGSATLLMPAVKDLIDVNVKNNDQIVKMAAIVQRASNNNKEGDDLFDMSEIQSLIESQNQLENSKKQIESKVTSIKP